MLHIPILRRGQPYRSVETSRTPNMRTGQPFVEISQANVGLIRRDLLKQAESRAALDAFTTAQLLDICRRAADIFANDTLPLGDTPQTPQDYVEQLSATTGLPYVLVRNNMAKIRGVMAEMEQVLRGLTRGVNLEVLDRGHSGGLSYFPRAHTLGVVLPSNSPGVHSLWIPAVALKTALVLKPGSAEPWTPFRVIQALIKAGAPPEAFHFYPSDHAGAAEILRSSGRGMVFGDVSTTKLYANDPRIEVHGPGFSKVLLGDDEADNWEKHINVIAASIADNSGRSCVNASGGWTPRHGAAIADALAEKLSSIQPKPADDPEAQLAPFADPNVAKRISAMIDEGLMDPGAREATQRPARVAEHAKCTYLLPSLIHCDSPDHTLANREFLFPFAAVVECPQSEMVHRIGPSLVVTAITNDENFKRSLLNSPHVGRLNFGPIATNRISWDQPHEGNLFEHLYARRAFQVA
jgi:acyl-CoA reductase-like NAD-dependent aldehyde dehydrogenase